MRLAVGRILSILVMAGGWVLVGIRTVLDLIGYSTVPEDIEVARSRMERAFDNLQSVPWWAVFGFALISTIWLMRVSWPRSEKIVLEPENTEEPTIREIGKSCIKMAKRLRGNVGRKPDYQDFFYLLRPEIASIVLHLQNNDIFFDMDALNYKTDYSWITTFCQSYLATIGPLLRDGHIDHARLTATSFFNDEDSPGAWPQRPRDASD